MRHQSIAGLQAEFAKEKADADRLAENLPKVVDALESVKHYKKLTKAAEKKVNALLDGSRVSFKHTEKFGPEMRVYYRLEMPSGGTSSLAHSVYLKADTEPTAANLQERLRKDAEHYAHSAPQLADAMEYLEEGNKWMEDDLCDLERMYERMRTQFGEYDAEKVLKALLESLVL